MYRNIVSNELFTIIILVGLLIVAIAKLTAPKRFYDFINVVGNSKYLKIYSLINLMPFYLLILS